MSREIPMLSLVKRGSKSFPRYAVAKSDEYRNPTYWTGSGWSSDPARLLPDHQHDLAGPGAGRQPACAGGTSRQRRHGRSARFSRV